MKTRRRASHPTTAIILMHPSSLHSSSSKVIWGVRYRGCISNDMDLAFFPLDSDSISINIGPKDETVDKVILKIDPAKHGFEGAPGDRIKKVRRIGGSEE